MKDQLETDGPVLSLDKICKSFGGLSVLFEVDLLLFPQEIVGLIGPNGAGKSTLFNVITSIYLPDAGEIFLNGEKITGRSPHSICHMGVSRTFQLVKVFLSMTALDNVLVGATYGHSQKLSRKKPKGLLWNVLTSWSFLKRRLFPLPT